MKLCVVNGPNLNMLGQREPHIYGHESYDDLVKKITDYGLKCGVDISVVQSNHEGEIIDWIQSAASEYNGLIINPAAFTHYSYAVLDALYSVEIPIVEVHISNIYKRESFRRHSVTAAASNGVITGFGTYGYLMAVDALVEKLNQ